MARTRRIVRGANRRLLPRAERRATIVEAAARTFARAGYAHTSMDDVAAAAGITKLIVYRHFRSKETLYGAVLRGAFDRLAPRLASDATTAGYGIGAHALLALAREDEAGFRLLWRYAPREPRFAHHADVFRRRAVAIVRAALADRVPKQHVAWAAHAVVGYLVEAVLNWLEFGDPARDDRFVTATNDALQAGVRAWAEHGAD